MQLGIRIACALFTALAAAVATLPAGATPTGFGTDSETVAWAVLPPGNGYPFGPTASHLDDQRAMYDGIDDAAADGSLAAAESLAPWYRPLSLGPPAATEVRRVEAPRPGLTISWDAFGVPHVVGTNATDVAFGAGWTMAQARGLLADISREVGRSGALELGAQDLFSALGADKRIDWTDEELAAGLEHLTTAAAEEAPQVLAELDAYVDGFNSWVESHPLPHRLLRLVLGLEDRAWRRTDVVAALLTVVGGQASGGAELDNARIRLSLDAGFGPQRGADVYDELRSADEPTTTHVEERHAYPAFTSGPGTTDAASIAMPDVGTADALPVPRQLPGNSNVIVATAAASDDGHPILVGGPQNAITSPALLFEAHLSGGGYEARGVLMPGVGPYVVVGRNRTSAWTSTSGESDQTDTRAELLCEPDGTPPTPDSRHYAFRGACLAMTRPPGARPGTAWRTRHGPVVAFGSVGGRPVAFSLERASRGYEAMSSLALRRLNSNRIATPTEFLDATRHITFSGNWFWVDSRHAAYAHVGRYPVRAAGASTEFPTWGTGEWEWQGVIDPASQPHAVDPASGFLTSWNNKVAPGWRTADDDWGNVGPHRVDLLAGQAEGMSGVTIGEMVDLHTRAGVTDLRGSHVLPEVLEILGSGPAPSSRLAAVRDELAAWVASGAARRDRNRDWLHDQAGPVIMDAFFERAVRVVFADLEGLWDILRPPIDTGPRTNGSSFGYGWYGLLWRDLRRAAGTEPGTAHCGGGVPDACRAALWEALDAAQREVSRGQLPWNGAQIPRWTGSTARERIWFLPYVFNARSLRWSNRPAYEMAVSFRDG